MMQNGVFIISVIFEHDIIRQVQMKNTFLGFQVKVWFQNRRMKWRHSKEAQAQKDKDKEQPDKSTTEAEPKEREDSECESEPSESEFEDGPEDKSDVDMCELNKTSVIIPTNTEDTTEPNTDSQTLL